MKSFFLILFVLLSQYLFAQNMNDSTITIPSKVKLKDYPLQNIFIEAAGASYLLSLSYENGIKLSKELHLMYAVGIGPYGVIGSELVFPLRLSINYEFSDREAIDIGAITSFSYVTRQIEDQELYINDPYWTKDYQFNIGYKGKLGDGKYYYSIAYTPWFYGNKLNFGVKIGMKL